MYHDKTKLHEIASQTLANSEEFWHKEVRKLVIQYIDVNAHERLSNFTLS